MLASHQEEPMPKTVKITKKKKVNQDKPQAAAPIPTRILNEPMFRGEEKEDAKQEEEKEELVEEEEEEVKLPQNQENKPNVILNDVLATVPQNTNSYRRKKEIIESEVANQLEDYDFLYPHLDDPEFSYKIAKHKEFYENRYDGTIHNVEEYANKMCNASFELMPHQIFVKNFLSFETPYNSLFLYHGLGTGKTCSAIGITEEMRSYMKQVGIKKRILIVASPNVQDNFKMQLFDERKLRETNGVWNIQSCLGNSLLREMNPTSLKNIPKEKVISQIQSIINNNYLFMGYIELGNYIRKKTSVSEESGFNEKERKKMEIEMIRREFNNRLIVIDEVHNLKVTQEGQDTKTAQLLMKIAKYSDNMRMVLLSATPMYNSVEEIIWITNLMNLNDKRSTIANKEVFDKNGAFRGEKKDNNGVVIQESGYDLLQRKLTGYFSYVRGENPYTFPYRIYPDLFAPNNTFEEPTTALGSLGNAAQAIVGNYAKKYRLPTLQLNGKNIETPLEHTPLYVNEVQTYQEAVYEVILKKTQEEMDNGKVDYEDLDKFGFRMLQSPLEALTMVYPNEIIDKYVEEPQSSHSEELFSIVEQHIGKRGLYNVMNFVDDTRKPVPLKHSYSYKPEIVEKYGPIFREDVLEKYSSKIHSIIQSVKKSKGIVMIYTQYIDGGALPIALALEEIGFARYGTSSTTKSLFEKPRADPLDSKTMKPRRELENKTQFKQAKYVMITGDKAFSPQNTKDLKEVTRVENKNGELVKVVLISRAGSEGLDFKNIRQIHIVDPWYNTNRIEQIIGRGVRNLSHCMLPFEKRNVEIYMHASYLKKNSNNEAADVYVYRLAKNKALKIGKVTRLLKEISVDCIVHIGQTNFSVQQISTVAENQNIELELSSSPNKIKYEVGDKPFSSLCDYMDNCSYKCLSRDVNTIPERELIETNYSSYFANSNDERISQRIINLFRDQRDGQYFYSLEEIVAYVNVVKQYPMNQIYASLTKMVNNKSEFIYDKYGRRGNLVNKGLVYAFQPIEINDDNITIFERKVPVDYKRPNVAFEERKSFSEKTDKIKDDASLYASDYTTLLQQMVKNLEDASSLHNITSSDQNWYRHASRVMNQLQMVHNIGFDEIRKHIILHNVDFLMPAEKKILMDHFYAKVIDYEKLNEIEKTIKDYLDSKIIRHKNKTGFLLYEDDKVNIYVQDGDKGTWKLAEPEDKYIFEQSGLLKETLHANNSDYFSIMGFINVFRNNKEMVYRLKDLTQMQNNSGTRISGQTPGKGVLIRYLNTILGQEIYSLEQSKEIMQLGVCVIIEIVLRDYNEKQKDDKIWFLNPEQARYNNISKYRISKK